ncbi:threonine/serine exporter family protein [Nocardioides daphniae]|uniref:threonine/serine exporter family protein n=1 Tax=Nocardioides daphniae TaxID=402297 RepID=UPI0023B1DCFF|nr:threonine/serine exporter family protein [Nocardioides daphniae]
MATIVSVAPPTRRWLITVATGVTCASVVGLFLGGNWLVVLSAFVAAMAIDQAQLLLAPAAPALLPPGRAASSPA